MRDFDKKWQECAARARQAPARDEEAPAGFAARVVARLSASEKPSVMEVWQHLTMRLLAGTAVLLVVCAALELPHFRDPQPLKPGIENTVAQLVWSL